MIADCAEVGMGQLSRLRAVVVSCSPESGCRSDK